MKELHTDTFCWPDQLVDWFHTQRATQFKKTVNKIYDRNKTKFSSSIAQRRNNAGYNPGGTLTCTTQQWSSKCNSTYKDPHDMGRWSGLRIQGKKGRKISIITAYRTPKSKNTQTSTFHSQQMAIMATKGMENPKPRKQIIEDLSDLIKDIRKDPLHKVILAIDANEQLTTNSAIQRMATELGLHDLHGEIPKNSWTYNDGQRATKIDFLLGTDRVRKYTEKVGYVSKEKSIKSKHRAIFADINFFKLLGQPPMTMQKNTPRFTSEDPETQEKYIEVYKK